MLASPPASSLFIVVVTAAIAAMAGNNLAIILIMTSDRLVLLARFQVGRSVEGPNFPVPRSELVFDLFRFQPDRG
jgi:hypothetical protein